MSPKKILSDDPFMQVQLPFLRRGRKNAEGPEECVLPIERGDGSIAASIVEIVVAVRNRFGTAVVKVESSSGVSSGGPNHIYINDQWLKGSAPIL